LSNHLHAFLLAHVLFEIVCLVPTSSLPPPSRDGAIDLLFGTTIRQGLRFSARISCKPASGQLPVDGPLNLPAAVRSFRVRPGSRCGRSAHRAGAVTNTPRYTATTVCQFVWPLHAGAASHAQSAPPPSSLEHCPACAPQRPSSRRWRGPSSGSDYFSNIREPRFPCFRRMFLEGGQPMIVRCLPQGQEVIFSADRWPRRTDSLPAGDVSTPVPRPRLHKTEWPRSGGLPLAP